jgi:hypothetical protein
MITLDTGIIIFVLGLVFVRLETICRDFKKIKAVMRRAHPKEYQEVFGLVD